MHKYRLKISTAEWVLHATVLAVASLYAVEIAFFHPGNKASMLQVVIHIATIALALFNLFILYKKYNVSVELDNYSIRYNNFRKSRTINFTDITGVERSGSFPKALILHTTSGKVFIPITLHNPDEFIANLCKIIDTINYKIKYNRDNLLQDTPV